ncbi:putative iron-regulated protein [Pedobacter sp. UYP24]
MKKFLLVLFTFLPILAIAQADHYKIYDVKQGKTITLPDLISSMKDVDVLFFGEEHNDSIGHLLEADIFMQMHAAYTKIGLTMEMFPTDVQGIVDEYLAGYISEKNFIKDARAWNNYIDYKPLVEFAKTNHLSVIAANAATRYSNMVAKTGLTGLSALPKSSKTFLPPMPIDTALGLYYQKFIELIGGHGMGNMKIYQTQNLWDATMAWSISKFLKSNRGIKILQLNGRFHSDNHLGIFARLQLQLPKIKAVNISSFYAEDFSNPDWEKYKSQGDYIIVTDPAVKRSY